MKNRRIFTHFLCFLLAAAMLSACGAKQVPPQTQPTQAAEAAGETLACCI